MPRRSRGKRSGWRVDNGESPALLASVVPHMLTPPRDPPSVRQNPRRRFHLYVAVVINEHGLGGVSTGDIWQVLSSWSSAKWMQLESAQFWGPSGIQTGSSVPTRLHLLDVATGVDVDDRSGLSSDRPRVGLAWPPASRRVFNKDGSDLNLMTVTCAPAGSLELQLLVCVTCW